MEDFVQIFSHVSLFLSIFIDFSLNIIKGKFFGKLWLEKEVMRRNYEKCKMAAILTWERILDKRENKQV